jgi:hypothetical protein
LGLREGRRTRTTISTALNELKNRFCSDVLFEFSLYSLDGIKQGMEIENE